MQAKNRTLEIIAKLKDEATKRLEGMTGSFLRFKNSVVKHWANIHFAARDAMALMEKGWNGLKMGAKFAQQEEAFRNLADSYGANADRMVKAMKEASAGTISTMDIMQKASVGMTLGLEADKMEDLMKISRAAARATGEDVSFMFDSLITGMGRQSMKILDNLGILVKAEDAYKKYADANGLVASKLTDTQKRQAFLNEAIAKGEKIIKTMNVSSMTNAEAMQAIESGLKDVSTEILLLISNSTDLGDVAKQINSIGRSIREIKTGNKIGEMQSLINEIIRYKNIDMKDAFRLGLQLEKDGTVKRVAEAKEELVGVVTQLIRMRQVVDPRIFDLLTEEQLKRIKGVSIELENIKPNLDESGKSVENWFKKLGKYEAAIIDSTKNVVSGMTNLFGDFFYGFLTGSFKDMAEAFKNFGNYMLRILAELISKMIVTWILGKLIGVFDNMGWTGASDLLNKTMGWTDVKGSNAVGTDYVPSTGLYMLHQGEKVKSAKQVSQEDGKGDTYIIAPSFQLWTMEDVYKHKGVVENIIEQALLRNSSLRKSMIRLT